MAAIIASNDLADVKPFKNEWKIQVKIVHSWTQYTKYLGKTMEMTMSDASVSLDFFFTYWS